MPSMSVTLEIMSAGVCAAACVHEPWIEHAASTIPAKALFTIFSLKKAETHEQDKVTYTEALRQHIVSGDFMIVVLGSVISPTGGKPWATL